MKDITAANMLMLVPCVVAFDLFPVEAEWGSTRRVTQENHICVLIPHNRSISGPSNYALEVHLGNACYTNLTIVDWWHGLSRQADCRGRCLEESL